MFFSISLSVSPPYLDLRCSNGASWRTSTSERRSSQSKFMTPGGKFIPQLQAGVETLQFFFSCQARMSLPECRTCAAHCCFVSLTLRSVSASGCSPGNEFLLPLRSPALIFGSGRRKLSLWTLSSSAYTHSRVSQRESFALRAPQRRRGGTDV